MASDGYRRVVRHLRKRDAEILKGQKAAYLDRAGMSPAMWAKLEELHLARLNPERGLRASLRDPTLCALYARGLATGSSLEGFDGDGWLWTTTEQGKAMHMAGPE